MQHWKYLTLVFFGAGNFLLDVDIIDGIGALRSCCLRFLVNFSQIYSCVCMYLHS
jgi:hypothetical protein